MNIGLILLDGGIRSVSHIGFIKALEVYGKLNTSIYLVQILWKS